jgi:hypothetical protein
VPPRSKFRVVDVHAGEPCASAQNTDVVPASETNVVAIIGVAPETLERPLIVPAVIPVAAKKPLPTCERRIPLLANRLLASKAVSNISVSQD